MALTREDLLRQLDRWLLAYEEKPKGRFAIKHEGRWLTLMLIDGTWHWTTKQGQGTVNDDAALESLLERVFPE